MHPCAKALRQEGTEHAWEAARRIGGSKGRRCHTVHLPSPSTPPQAPSAGQGDLWGQEGHPAQARAPGLTAEGCTGAWTLIAADGFAGDTGVQQRVPVLPFGAGLHGHPQPQALWG